jgi:hypothetical protein
MKYLVVAILLLAGCADRQVPVSTDARSDIKMEYQKPHSKNWVTPWTFEGYDVPNWVLDPTLNGKYEAGCGSANLSGKTLSEAKEAAFTAAVNEIASARKVHIKSVFKSYQTDGIDYTEDVAKIDVDNRIANAKVVDSWTHSSTKDYYVWVVVSNP